MGYTKFYQIEDALDDTATLYVTTNDDGMGLGAACFAIVGKDGQRSETVIVRREQLQDVFLPFFEGGK